MLALCENIRCPGIFLTPEQWEAVAGAANDIDAAINALGGGVAGSSCNPISQDVLMLGWNPCSQHSDCMWILLAGRLGFLIAWKTSAMLVNLSAAPLLMR